MIGQIALALVASVCSYMVLAALAVPVPSKNDGRAYAAALVFVCAFVLVLAAERGWYS
jgi:hypothetical protein